MRSRIPAVAVLVVFMGAGLCAQPKAAIEPFLMKKLGLSQEQVAEIREVYAEASAATRLVREDLKIQQAELAKILMAAAPARADYERIVKRIAELEASMRLTRIEAELTIRRTIGDEKWAQLRKALRIMSKKSKEKAAKPWLRTGGKK